MLHESGFGCIFKPLGIQQKPRRQKDRRATFIGVQRGFAGASWSDLYAQPADGTDLHRAAFFRLSKFARVFRATPGKRGSGPYARFVGRPSVKGQSCPAGLLPGLLPRASPPPPPLDLPVPRHGFLGGVGLRRLRRRLFLLVPLRNNNSGRSACCPRAPPVSDVDAARVGVRCPCAHLFPLLRIFAAALGDHGIRGPSGRGGAERVAAWRLARQEARIDT